ncbi:hypothetical protein STENM327S_08453 [Streptomyces tendae]
MPPLYLPTPRSAASARFEPLQQLGRAGPGPPAAQVEQAAEHLQVLPAGEHLVHGRVLAGEADARPRGAGDGPAAGAVQA